MLLRHRADFYAAAGLPGPDDVTLLIEVADTSLRYDRRVKGLLYAEAGIREYWIVDLAGDAVEVFREAGPHGFQRTDRVGRGGTLTPLAFPDTPLAAADVLG